MRPVIDKRSIESVVTDLMVSWARDGILDLRGKTHDEIANELVRIAHSYEWALVIDHTLGILIQARAFKEANLNLFACLFYALWMEHRINRFVTSLAQRKGISYEEIETIIRDTSYKSKCTWVFRLLDCAPFDLLHVNLIIRIMEARNSFVHYKWKPESEQAKQELEVVLSKIEETVEYIQQFEVEHLLGLTEGDIAQIAKLP